MNQSRDTCSYESPDDILIFSYLPSCKQRHKQPHTPGRRWGKGLLINHLQCQLTDDLTGVLQNWVLFYIFPYFRRKYFTVYSMKILGQKDVWSSEDRKVSERGSTLH